MFKRFSVTVTYYNRLDEFSELSMSTIASNPNDARDSGFNAVKGSDPKNQPQTITVIMEIN